MALYSFELQKSLFSRLNGGSIVDENDQAITGVFDDVPEGTAYPYVVIGEETATNIGTKDKDMHEYTPTLHVWSQYRGMRDVIQTDIPNATVNFEDLWESKVFGGGFGPPMRGV